jgi:hypothetical protein
VNRKLVVFVPREALNSVREALFAAGAGRIGEYERCSWYTEGTGTFLGGEGTEPSVGKAGREERVRNAPLLVEPRHAKGGHLRTARDNSLAAPALRGRSPHSVALERPRARL